MGLCREQLLITLKAMVGNLGALHTLHYEVPEAICKKGYLDTVRHLKC